MTTTQKVAFITGAGKGIGLETAKGLGNKGVHIVLGVRKQSQNALSILMGVLPNSIARNGNLSNINLRDNLPMGVLALLLSNRTDVKAKNMN